MIGKSLPRVDARDKVTGRALYPGDLTRPDMLHMKVLFAGRPHARIRSIDTSQAERAPGVVAVFTAADVPVNEYGLNIPDQPVLCGPGSTKPGADVVRFVGDQVALVVAETEEQAAAARDLIRVEYEDLPVVADMDAALAPDAPILHPDRESNVLCHYRIRKGDVEAGFAQADVILEGEYETPMQEHAYLQPEAGLAYIDETGRVTVEVAGQWTHEDREQIAHALGLPEDQVRVIYPAIGGAFGGREDISVQIILALAAWRLHQRGIHRPVKIVWSREESIIGHHKRHRMRIRHRWGATRDGRITAMEVECIGDAGAYAYTSTKVMGNVHLMSTGPYEVPNASVDTYAVYTNNIPAGAFRGFGAPQALFAAETHMNKLAEKLGIDPITIRLRNCLREGSIAAVQTPMPKGVSLPAVIERCAREAGWRQEGDRWIPPEPPKPEAPVVLNSLEAAAPPGVKRRGVGFACGYKNVGFSFGAPESCTAIIELRGGAEIEEVVLRHAAAEVGQGVHTALVQMAAEAVGVPPERVRLIVSDTAETENSGSVSASRMTFMAGNAIRGAVEIALQRWREEERPAIGHYVYRPPRTTPYDPETGRALPNFAYGYVAQCVFVEVDEETGEVRPLNVVSVNDVGRAVNPQQVEGQIEGGVVQAVGWTLLEDFIVQDGQVLTPHLSTYLIPTVADVPPRVRSVIAEHPDPLGPWGVRGVGEMPFLTVAPAIIAAVHDATGVWFDRFPLTPERVLRGLGRLDNGR
ncbi:MAG: molybdopterin-dependent oxidoreductase [Chloroflexi bacterium]|nr:molybdopterin-dependent oxidoreductase [Chloroflexota bacterium]